MKEEKETTGFMSANETEGKKLTVNTSPKRGLVEDIRIHNEDNMKTIAGEYFGAKYTYAQTLQMINEYKKAFISVDGKNDDTITICAPSTIASVNAFYGASETNKIINLVPPGFLHVSTEYYTHNLGSKTLFIYDGFLSDELIDKLYAAGVKNLIVTSISDYMHPVVKFLAIQKGLIPRRKFIDEYVRSHKSFPRGMDVIDIKTFSEIGSSEKETYSYHYKENQIAARFLTGATTSQLPKCVLLTVDGFAKMGEMYDKCWFDFCRKERLAVIIPLFYATGFIHGLHMGLIEGMTLVYKPKYDRFTFGKDLIDSKANVAVVAPSHVATLDESGLKKGSLSHVKYIFIGGEAIMPAQIKKFRKTAERLGIQYILNGYGMTETGSMLGISEKGNEDLEDVSIVPLPGIQFRIVDSVTGEELPENERGILEVKTPCATQGYFEKEHNKKLFTADGWIHTGDIAIRFSNGRYRVFGRENDFYTNNGTAYAMFDIEEKILELDEVAEAEVIKFDIDGQERPAAIVVLKKSDSTVISDVIKEIYSLKVRGLEHLIGVKFINRFKTNPVTSKRDTLSLQKVKDGYYSIDKEGHYHRIEIGGKDEEISCNDLLIAE